MSSFKIKIKLLHAKPDIWRSVVIPSNITLSSLHAVIQAAMGWQGYHLHLFEKQGQLFSEPDPEDIGGSPGYENFCKIMTDPQHPEYESMCGWYGSEFDPKNFDLKERNKALTKVKLKTKKRGRPFLRKLLSVN